MLPPVHPAGDHPAVERPGTPLWTIPRRLCGCLGRAVLILLLVASWSPRATAGETLAEVEEEFRSAIRSVTPATVVCRPRGAYPDQGGFSSGVLVSPRGLVLSDGDAGLVWMPGGSAPGKSWRDDVEVRVPGRGGKAAQTFRAKVIFRDTEIDTSLLAIVDPPEEDFPFVPFGTSDDLQIGQFALAMGTSFDESGGSPPTLTAGLLCGFSALGDGTQATNRYRYLLTSAAVNQGVNGGPLIDLRGRLIGTISTYLDPEPAEPFQFLGRVVPIDRVRAALASVRAAAPLLAPPATIPQVNTSAGRSLETTFRAAALRAWPSVVSLSVARSRPLSRTTPLDDSQIELPRYTGPVSAIALGREGLVLTSLYNLTNLAQRARPLWQGTRETSVASGLNAVTGATVHLPDGSTAPAMLLGHDLRLGVALFQMAAGSDGTTPVVAAPVAAPAEALARGRFVLAVGNPFGDRRPADPLLTMGLLSKLHSPTTPAPWRGQWQTDATGIDSNAGGAVVDVEGRMLGMLTLWHPARHGRGSGIAFVVPWSDIEAALPRMRLGQQARPAFLGVEFERRRVPVIARVVPGTAAALAGLVPGDRLLALDGHPVASVGDVRLMLANRLEGESLLIAVRRRGTRLEVQTTLAPR